MRILYLFRSLAVWGGIERILVDKMNYLVTKYGYDVYMLTTDQGKHRVPYQMEESIHLEDLDIQFHKQYRYRGLKKLWDAHQRTGLFERRLSERIESIRPDLIVCTSADPVYSITKVKGSIPLVVETHSIFSRTFGEKSIRKQFNAYLLRKGLKKSACVVTLTERDAMEWRKIHPRVEVIPNMVNLNEGDVSTLTNKRVIFVGRLDYQKRPLEAIKIWQQVFPKFPDWHLNIYGEGDQYQQVVETAENLNMNIHVHRPTNQIFDCYRESSLLILTSLFEPFGLVIPEAMSCGLPVISYDSPYGPSVIINSGENGFLIKEGDVKGYSDIMCLLMEKIEMRKRIGSSGILSSYRYKADIIMPFWNQLFCKLSGLTAR